MNKKGFTLAEVLITLGIIGVIVAMTLPNLIKNYRAQQAQTQFKKAYSVAQQVLSRMKADDKSMNAEDYPSFEFYKTFIEYLPESIDCGTYAGSYASSQKYCYKPSLETTVDNYKTFNDSNTAHTWILDDGTIAIKDGTAFYFENCVDSNRGIFVSFDINGYNKKPNRWGYDLFTFQLVNGFLKPMGDTETNYPDAEKYCNKTDTSDLNGITCAYKALSDPDYFKKIMR